MRRFRRAFLIAYAASMMLVGVALAAITYSSDIDMAGHAIINAVFTNPTFSGVTFSNAILTNPTITNGTSTGTAFTSNVGNYSTTGVNLKSANVTTTHAWISGSGSVVNVPAVTAATLSATGRFTGTTSGAVTITGATSTMSGVAITSANFVAQSGSCTCTLSSAAAALTGGTINNMVVGGSGVGAAASVTTAVGTNTTDATSATTGAFHTAGGLGVAKALNVGTSVKLAGQYRAPTKIVVATILKTGLSDNVTTTIYSVTVPLNELGAFTLVQSREITVVDPNANQDRCVVSTELGGYNGVTKNGASATSGVGSQSTTGVGTVAAGTLDCGNPLTNATSISVSSNVFTVSLQVDISGTDAATSTTSTTFQIILLWRGYSTAPVIAAL